MKFWIFLFLLQACSVVPPNPEELPACSELTQFDQGQYCKLSLRDIRVTQPTVGMTAVWERVPKIENAFKKGTLNKYRQERTAPVVVGPGQEFFITDRHHLSLAMNLSRLPDQQKYLHAVIIGNLSELTPEQFWAQMIDRQWVLLRKHGQPINPSSLPLRIQELEDDPYRSLARYALKAGYFSKSNQAFIEFDYADQYRQTLKIPNQDMPQSSASLKKLLTKIPR